MITKYIEELSNKCTVTELLQAAEDEGAVEKLKSKVKAELPASFENFYKKYNGEAEVQGFAAGFELLPIERVIAEFDFLKKSGIEFAAIGTEAISDKPISKNKWIPFAFDGSECFLAIDLSPAKGGTVGQVIGLDMEADNAYLFAYSFDAFFEKLAKLVEDEKLVIDADGETAVVSEATGHFFNQVAEYAVMDESIQNVDVVLEDEFWLKKFEKQLKNKDGKCVVSSRLIGKQTGSFRIMNNPQKLSCKPFEFMENIKELIIHHCELRDFESIAKMKNLATLYLIDCTTPGCNVAVLVDAPKLKRLSLGELSERVDMKRLSTSKSIKELTVRTLEGVSYLELGEFRNLTALTVSGGLPEEYSFLSKLGKLKTLKISNVQLDNLEFLYNLLKLEEFEMNTPAKNEDGLAALGSMTKLKLFVYPVKDLAVYKGVTSIEEAGVAYVNNEQYDVFVGSKLNSIKVIGDGGREMMKTAENIANVLKGYGLRITSYGSIG